MIGVVLMGGKSRRMGTDKAMLPWLDKPLWSHMASLLSEVCDEVHLSVNENQLISHTFPYSAITDLYPGEGPAGAMVSCYIELRTPLFFLSCDMPKITVADLGLLQNHYLAHDDGLTMYYNEDRNCYEPVCSVWGTQKLNRLVDFFIKGGRSLQAFLDSFPPEKLLPENPTCLENINTPESYHRLVHNPATEIRF